MTGSASFKTGGDSADVSRRAPRFEPETPARDAIRVKSQSPFQGTLVMNVPPPVAEELSLNGVREGVVVADVAEGSLAVNLGVEKGDVFLEVNGAKIATTRDLETASGQRARYWDLTIARGGQVIRSRIGG